MTTSSFEAPPHWFGATCRMKPGACRVRATGAATGAGTQMMPGCGLVGAPEKPLLILKLTPEVLGATVA